MFDGELMTGWLQKKAAVGLVKGWKNRWFVIVEEQLDAQLKYFTSGVFISPFWFVVKRTYDLFVPRHFTRQNFRAQRGPEGHCQHDGNYRNQRCKEE